MESAEKQMADIRAMLGSSLQGPASSDPKQALMRALALQALARQQQEARAEPAVGPAVVPEGGPTAGGPPAESRPADAPQEPGQGAALEAGHAASRVQGLPSEGEQRAILRGFEDGVRLLQQQAVARFQAELQALADTCLAQLRGESLRRTAEEE